MKGKKRNAVLIAQYLKDEKSIFIKKLMYFHQLLAYQRSKVSYIYQRYLHINEHKNLVSIIHSIYIYDHVYMHINI